MLSCDGLLPHLGFCVDIVPFMDGKAGAKQKSLYQMPLRVDVDALPVSCNSTGVSIFGG